MQDIPSMFSLDEHATLLLCYYAFATSDVDSRELNALAKASGIPSFDIKALSKRFANLGYILPGGYDWYGGKYAYHIAPRLYVPFLSYLIHFRRQEWTGIFQKAYNNYHYSPDTPYYFVEAAIDGKEKKLKNAYFDPRNQELLCMLPFEPDLLPLARLMNEDSFIGVMGAAVKACQTADAPDEEGILKRVLEDRENYHHTRIEPVRQLLAFDRYLAFGERPVYDDEHMYEAGGLMNATELALHGRYDEAQSVFENIFKVTNKVRDLKFLYTDLTTSYIHVMTCAHLEGDTPLRRMTKYTKEKALEGNSAVEPARLLAGYFMDKSTDIPMSTLRGICEAKGALHYFGHLLSQYFQHTEIASAELKKAIPRYAFYRHELSAYLPLDDAERHRLQEAFGTHPLLTSIRRKAPWEQALEDLMASEEPVDESGKTAAQLKARLVYVINSGSILVREQNRLKSGEWGVGKNVSWSRWIGGQIDCMEEADRRILARCQSSYSYDLEPADVLPELVGSDRVMTGRSAPFHPVEVRQEQPYLMIEKEADGFVVKASYEAKKASDMWTSTTHIVTRRSKYEYVVTPLDGRQRRFYDELLRIRRFPLEAEEMLKTFFPKVSHVLEVHSSTFTEGNTLETVEGSPMIYLQVSPREMAFEMHVVVRPLDGGRLTFTPGKGAVLIVDEAEGKRVQVNRPLKEEKRRMKMLKDILANLTETEMQEGYILLNAEEMLSLLESLNSLGELFAIEWEQGRQLKLKRAAQPEKWHIDLKGRGGWFDLEGEVRLDDDTVLSMAQLLELVGSSRSEYIRLNETDYLHLSDNLHRQLARIEAAAVHQRGKVEIPALQAGLWGQEVLDGEFTVTMDDSLRQLRDRIAESQTLSPKVPSKLQATLRDYQQEGFEWIARLNHWGAGACLADDMGLGKTVQTIAYLLYIAKEGASLVVAPASVVPNWKRELERFAPSLRVSMLNETTDRAAVVKAAKASDVVVSTYGLLVSESEVLTAKEWNVVCLDEAHTIKNRETKTSGVAMQLKAAHRLILTGTPVQNHLGELWNLFQFINPGLLGSYEQFHQKFIAPIEGDHDKQRQQQLNRLVHPFMLRRTKREVVEELPDKEEIILPVEMTDEEMSVYEVIRRKARQMVAEGGARVNVATLAQITKLRQAACCVQLAEKKWKGGSTKIDRLVELMQELRENGHRALVFSQFTSFFTLIRQALDKAGISYLYLDGSVTVKQRQQLVDEFQSGECPFFLISLKAGGLGLNLTGANYIIHLDPWWNPAIEQQATDRAYRIGQTQKVTAYHLVSAHTIEEKILRLHDTKRNLSDALLEGTDVSHKLTADDLMDILDEPV